MSECPSVTNPFLHGPTAYRERAERLRAMAKDLATREWREILLRRADSYEKMARSEGIA